MAQTGNADWKNWNKVENWRLRCFELKELSSGAVVLKCSMNGRKKNEVDENGKPMYEKSMPLDVYCNPETCQIEQQDYTNQTIFVDGHFSHSEYTPKNGESRLTFTVYADKVTLA